VFLAHPFTRMELGPKAMEEKALEGRTPTRVRFDDRWEYSYFNSSGLVVPLPGCVSGTSADADVARGQRINL